MILLLGSTGYIGQEFYKQLFQKGNIVRPCTIPAKEITYGQLELLHKTLNLTSVVNCAGYTGKPNVDACENDKHNTIYGNVCLPTMLSQFCGKHNITFAHVSSGCIYTGRRSDGKPFTESDRPNFSFEQNNCSFYSGTKAMAEDVIRKNTDKHYIWRLRIPFEEKNNPRNYLSKMLNYKKLLDAENSISNKQEFVNACIETLTKKVPYGTYNVVNTGHITTKEVVELMTKTIAKDRTFEFFDNEEQFYNTAAKTPRSNCVMSNQKLIDAGIKMSSVYDSLDYCLNNWK
jgi:UDP-glucose 4,6-dehydratase